MGALLRVVGLGLAAFGVMLVLIALSDDAPGAMLIALVLFGAAGYAFLNSRHEDARAARLEELLRRIADRP